MSTYTRLRFGDDARSKLLEGATRLADLVRVTLGPTSQSVLLGGGFKSPSVCDDGVTIARAVQLKDAEADVGVRMLREAAVKTGDLVGDGTTASTLLGHNLLAEGIRNVVAGANAVELKRGMELGLSAAVEALHELAEPSAGRDDMVQVATVSAHNDHDIGTLVAEAIERVGSEGVVSIEEARTMETTLEVVEGMLLDRGYISPYFITDPQRRQAVLDEPLILLTDRKITSMSDLLPLLEQVLQTSRSLLIIAEDVDGEALATLVVNKLRGTFACAAVKAPAFGDRRKDILHDIAALTGAHVVSSQLGEKLSETTMEMLGSARRAVLGKDDTTLVGGAGDKAAIKGRCAEIRHQLEESTSEYDREKLAERLGKLAGGVAVIRVGAPSEAEMKRRKEAFEDALSATRAAVAEGVVPGGGVALLRVAAAVERVAASDKGDVGNGVQILRRALEVPARQIARNSNSDAGVVVERILGGQGWFGYNAIDGSYMDLKQAGILDPVKVVRIALENAVSVAGTMLLTAATCIDIEEPDPMGPSDPNVMGPL